MTKKESNKKATSLTLQKLLRQETKIHLDSDFRKTKVLVNGLEIPITSIEISQGLGQLPLVRLEFRLDGGITGDCTLVGKELSIDFKQ